MFSLDDLVTRLGVAKRQAVSNVGMSGAVSKSRQTTTGVGPTAIGSSTPSSKSCPAWGRVQFNTFGSNFIFVEG